MRCWLSNKVNFPYFWIFFPHYSNSRMAIGGIMLFLSLMETYSANTTRSHLFILSGSA